MTPLRVRDDETVEFLQDQFDSHSMAEFCEEWLSVNLCDFQEEIIDELTRRAEASGIAEPDVDRIFDQRKQFMQQAMTQYFSRFI